MTGRGHSVHEKKQNGQRVPDDGKSLGEEGGEGRGDGAWTQRRHVHEKWQSSQGRSRAAQVLPNGGKSLGGEVGGGAGFGDGARAQRRHI